MDERPRPRVRVGLGNRPVNTRIPDLPAPSARTTLETFATLGILHQQGLGRTPAELFMDSIVEAEELDSAHVVDFHRALPLEQQDEIKEAMGKGLLGVHMAEYALLRQRGIGHEHALVLAQEAARIRFQDPQPADL